MKKLLFLSILIIPLIFVSCEKTVVPVAGFHTDTVEPEVGQAIIFYNDSHDAERFEWDFGDGYISNEPNPVHAFNSTGVYEVKLTAISKSNLVDNASLSMTVMVPTLLEIEVLEYYDLYVVPGASIILYPTLADWDAQTNQIIEGITDEYGIAVFAGLANVDHYVDVWEQNHDNYALRAEDPEFIHIMQVVPHQINRFTAYVDYVQHTTGAKGARSMVIRKFERKASGRVLSPLVPATDNWLDLYNKRVNK
jgi:PKD repeat protein